MKAVAQRFRSFAEAEKADRDYYRAMSHCQRLDLLLELIASQRPEDETAEGLARVYRIVERHKK